MWETAACDAWDDEIDRMGHMANVVAYVASI
jgi:hypothetical protein